jgi:hypothetical protein
MRRSVVRTVCAAAVVAALVAGCSDVEAEPAPSETVAESVATPTPTALSEAEALEIVETTYEAYLAATGEVYAHGEDARDEYLSVVSEDFSKVELDSLIAASEERDLVTEGAIEVVKTKIQRIKPDSVTAYLCTDASNARLYEEGTEPTPRPQNIYTLEVEFVLSDTGAYLLNRSDTWDDDEFCSEFL